MSTNGFCNKIEFFYARLDYFFKWPCTEPPNIGDVNKNFKLITQPAGTSEKLNSHLPVKQRYF